MCVCACVFVEWLCSWTHMWCDLNKQIKIKKWITEMRRTHIVHQNQNAIFKNANQARFCVGTGTIAPPPNHRPCPQSPNVTWNTFWRTQNIGIQVQKGVFCGLQNTLNVLLAPLRELTTLTRPHIRVGRGHPYPIRWRHSAPKGSSPNIYSSEPRSCS